MKLLTKLNKHTHLIQLSSLTIICLVVGGSLYFGSRPVTTTQNVAFIPIQDNLQNPGFTTILDSAMTIATTPAKETAIFKPTHSSDILKSVEFEQHEYFAFLTPNDPSLPLWHLNAVGATAAWDKTTGSSEIVIAIIDSGFALNHQELFDGWYINNAEQGTTAPGDFCWTGTATNKQINVCDDDQNGYIDDFRGWDFYSIDNNPQAGEINPSGAGVAHGTMVSGLIGATANNASGFPGIDWQAKIMPLQALSDNGSGYTSDIVAAVEYAVDNGADIINMSLGGGYDDNALRAAVTYARSQNVTIVAASGNCATLAYSFCSNLSAPGYMGYPAIYDEVISVGAVNSSGVRASFSSYGPKLDIVGPGQGVPISSSWTSSNQTSAYTGGISGTSFSSPIVAGIVGLMKALKSDISSDDITQVLRVTSSSANSFSSQYGYGSVSAISALNFIAGNANSTLGRGQIEINISSNDGENPGNPVNVGEGINTAILSEPSDQVYLEAKNLNTGQKIKLQTNKLDETGSLNYIWNTNQVGAGVWSITPHGLQSSGKSETIYISN